MRVSISAQPIVTSAKHLYQTQGDKLRYLIVGAFNSGWSYGLFVALLVVLGGPLRSLSSSHYSVLAIIGAHYYLVIQWFVWVISIPPNTLLMRHFAFRAQGDWRHQVARGYLVYLPAQLLNAGLLVLMVRGFGLTPILGQLSAAVIVTVMTYLGHKYFTFRKTIR